MIQEASWFILMASTLRVSTPLLFAALGGLMSERSGVVNIALEGFMLIGSFIGAVVALQTQSIALGFAAAAAGGAIFALIYAFFTVRVHTNQIVAGTAMNMLAMGLTPFLCKALYQSSTSSPALEVQSVWSTLILYAAWALVPVIAFWLNRVSSGMWLQFAGEKPDALEATGVSVTRVRWWGVTMSGVLAGIGGATLSLSLASSFSRGMTAGRGFMALAALIFGKWRPIPTAIACLLFGFADAMQIRLQGVILWGTEPVPVQFIQILPYVLTMLMLSGFVGSSRPPKVLGLPYRRG